MEEGLIEGPSLRGEVLPLVLGPVSENHEKAAQKQGRAVGSWGLQIQNPAVVGKAIAEVGRPEPVGLRARKR